MEEQNLIPFQISAEEKDKTAYIRIIGHIGYRTNSEIVRELVDEQVAKGCTSAHLYINSPGGSCFSAEEIVNILIKSFGSNITGAGGALVASAAAYIATYCKKFEMPENGKLMIHKPSGFVGGTATEIANYLKLLQDIEKEYYARFKFGYDRNLMFFSYLCPKIYNYDKYNIKN